VGAGITVFAILLAVITHPWLEIVKDYLLVCSLLARVASSSWLVVAFNYLILETFGGQGCIFVYSPRGDCPI
jgi:hypothetical protein